MPFVTRGIIAATPKNRKLLSTLFGSSQRSSGARPASSPAARADDFVVVKTLRWGGRVVNLLGEYF
jgi:hypothetical protein